MSILFSGSHILPISRKALRKKFKRKKYENIKYHITLGDMGLLLPGEAEKNKTRFSILSERPFPVLCVTGDFDAIFGMNNVPEVNIGIGEKTPLYEFLVAEEQNVHNRKLNDEVAFLNDEIHAKIQFREWWCGHWPQNKFYNEHSRAERSDDARREA